jgi:hypothetical protein
MKRPFASIASVTLALTFAGPAAAQIAWDAPRLSGPESPSGLGLYWSRAEVLPGDHNVVFATFSLPGTNGAVSVRGGIGTGAGEETAAFGGVDLRAPIARHTDAQPLDLEWSGGAGLGVGEYVLISVPVAVSAGRSWASGSVWFAPYVSMGATFDYRIGESDAMPDEEFEIQATAGIGVDMAFDAARRVVLRVSTAVGERQALALGVVVGG